MSGIRKADLAAAEQAARRLVEVLHSAARGDLEAAQRAAQSEVSVLTDILGLWAVEEPLLSMHPDFADLRAESRILATLTIDEEGLNADATIETASSVHAGICRWQATVDAWKHGR